MAAAYSTFPLDRHFPPLDNPVGHIIPNEKSLLNSIPNTFLVSDLEFNDDRYPLFTRTLGHQRSSSSMDQARILNQSNIAQSQLIDADDWSRGIGDNDPIEGIHAVDDMKQQAYDQQTMRNESPVQLSASSFRSKSDSRTPTMSFQKNSVENNERHYTNGNLEHHNDVTATTINLDSTTSFSNLNAKSNEYRKLQQSEELLLSETPKVNASDQDQLPQDTLSPLQPSTPRHPSASASARDIISRSSTQFANTPNPPLYRPSPIALQMSAMQRVSVQQPTYVTPTAAASPVNPIYSPGPPLIQEEVCIECAMRDQDMADVDVTSPGVWDRESDIYYHEMVQQEMEEEAKRTINPDYIPNLDPNRPSTKGGRLTEQSVKIWLSLNPREPQSRRQAIEAYVRTQVAFLEAEALARARALKESRDIDNMMRNTYDHLRRSTLDSSAQVVDDTGGVRIRSVSGQIDGSDVQRPYHHSREVTLLENGLIVEHVDVRKEEKEERERRKKEERRERSRARKSSRSSVVDMMSIYSAQSPLPPQDNDLFSSSKANGEGRSISRFSQMSSRPLSPSSIPQHILTPPMRPSNGRLMSQVSLADTQSISSASLNKRSRFFAFKNWSEAWKSRESFAPSGMSGSMLDMHVALDNEAQYRLPPLTDAANNVQKEKPAEQWPSRSASNELGGSLDRAKKKKGLAKIWRMFSGPKVSQKHSDTRQYNSGIPVTEKHEDNFPLTPPPPISYLVDRKITDRALSSRSPSTTPSMSSPNGASVSSPPSSSLSTPPVHPGWPDLDHGSRSKHNFNDFGLGTSTLIEEEIQQGKRLSTLEPTRSLTPMLSEPDIRQRLQQQSQTVSNIPSRPPSVISSTPRPYSTLTLDKMLPPLPHETQARSLPNQMDQRPRTMYTVGMFDEGPNTSSHGLVAPQAGFRDFDNRRKSFGGLTSRPDLSYLTLPANGKQQDMKRGSIVNQDEFGVSRQSLGVRMQSYPFPTRSEVPLSLDPSQTPSKRKSKFGLGVLLGKITHNDPKLPIDTPCIDYKVSYSSSQFDPNHIFNVATTPRSAKAISRMSVASRKAVEELVDQDPEFVAYRYPSTDHTFDIVR